MPDPLETFVFNYDVPVQLEEFNDIPSRAPLAGAWDGVVLLNRAVPPGYVLMTGADGKTVMAEVFPPDEPVVVERP